MPDTSAAILDRDQLRDVTLDDPELMREILTALIDDTTKQMVLIESAIQERNGTRCLRLAHYSKGACANVGASSAAATLKRMEQQASDGSFEECTKSLAALAEQVERLRSEVEKF